MSIYSVQLFAGKPPIGPTPMFTAPAGFVTIVRDLELFTSSASPLELFLSLYSGASLVAVLYAVTLATNHWSQWTGRTVMNAGQALAIGGADSGTTVILSGYQLTP